MFVRHEMYRDQTDGPRSANFAKHMHIDKVSSPTNVEIVKVLNNHFQVKKTASSFEGSRVVISPRLTGREEITIYDTLSQIWAFNWHIYI